MFTIDSFACGISPLGESLVILTFEKELQEEVTLKKSNAVFYSMFSAHFQDFLLWKYNIIIISCLSAKITLIMLFNPLFSKVMN